MKLKTKPSEPVPFGTNPGQPSDSREIIRENLERFSPAHEKIVNKLCSCGYEAYITGGAVRDLLLGREPLDYDVVTNARPDEIAMIFKNESVKEVGQAFNVTLINGIEVATYRQDTYHGGGHRDCTVNLVEKLHKDLERRDLTFNSMAFCPYTGDLIDPYDGKGDLENNLVRFVGDPDQRIKEDPDRIIRACRFASNLNARFEEKSLAALRNNIQRLEMVAPERLRLEIKKAMKTRKASRFFQNLELIGALDRVFPSLKACAGLDGGKHHGEDVFEHCMLVGDAISARCWLTKLTGYLHDVGKSEAVVFDKHGNSENFIGHESAGIHLLERDLRALKFSNQEISFITRLVAVHMRTLEPESSPKSVRKFLASINDFRMDYRTFIRFRVADRTGNKAKPAKTIGEIRNLLQIAEAEMFAHDRQQEFGLSMLAINGNDLMREFQLKPGPVVGKTLKTLLNKVIEEPAINDRRSLLELAEKIIKVSRKEDLNPPNPIS